MPGMSGLGQSGGGLSRRLLGDRDGPAADRPAFLDSRASLSYRDLRRLVDCVARRLRAAGALPGDRVLLEMPNSAEYVVAALGAMAAGAVVVPMTDAGPERRRFVTDSTRPRLRLTRSAATRSEGALRTIAVELDPETPSMTFDPDPGSASYASPRPDEPAMILFSSGSTGRPKGVVLTHAGLEWTAGSLVRAFDLDATHRELLLCPLSHSGAWQRLAATLRAGGCVVATSGPLSVAGLLEDAREFDASGFYTPPPMIRYLLQTSPARVRAALGGCRGIEIGSAPIAANELADLMRLLPRTGVFVHYGLTECSRAAILDARAEPARLATVGHAPPGVELRICDDAGNALAPGEAGEIHVRGPQLAVRYWEQPDLTRERFVDGWHRTGDHGSLDEGGFLTFLGRRDDRINSAGFSFFPAEVEAELGAVAGVEQYLVVGVEDSRGILGQVPCVLAVVADPASWTPGAFLETARRRLPPHMVPRKVVTVPRLVLTASGKPDRRRTRETYAGELGG